jgi:hypothetical protein
MIPRLDILGVKPPDPVFYGNKAVGLWRLRQCEVRIPPTVMVAAGLQPDWADLVWIAEQLGNPAEFIVRSSSSKEDTASESLAGVFTSEVAERPTLLAAVERVREQAATSSVCRQGRRPIPVLIQPRLGGPGGVYLFDRQCGRDSITLSVLGPSAVTSGTTTPSDQLPKNAAEYQAALEACRRVARRLGSVDLELILVDGDWIFLQCRPLTRPLSTECMAGLSSYFPSWLPPLCGTLWAEQLAKTLRLDGVRYDDGFILGLADSDDIKEATTVSTTECEAAERFYTEILFPKWENTLNFLRLVVRDFAAEAAYRETRSAWSEFLRDYFTNPHEKIVASARAAGPAGMAITPRLRNRLTMFAQAAGEVASEVSHVHGQPEKLLSLPSVAKYLNLYGFQLLEGHDFSQPTLAEQPAAFVALLTQAGRIELPDVVAPDALLRAAWLAEDDNDYKQRFCALLRQSILRLGADWTARGLLPERDAVWHLTATGVERVLAGRTSEFEKTATFRLAEGSAPAGRIGTFSAEILSPGRGCGVANRDGRGGANLILLRTVIETTDYPLLMSSAGAVVALGTPQSHGAIFARDIGKPLYRCPAVVQSVTEGTLLTLHDTPATVQVGGKLPSEG